MLIEVLIAMFVFSAGLLLLLTSLGYSASAITESKLNIKVDAGLYSDISKRLIEKSIDPTVKLSDIQLQEGGISESSSGSFTLNGYSVAFNVYVLKQPDKALTYYLLDKK